MKILSKLSLPVSAAVLLTLATLLPLMTLRPPTATAAPFSDQPAAVRAALVWLVTQQNTDGGFSGFGGSSDASSTLDAILAIAAAGQDPSQTQRQGFPTPIDYLPGSAPVYAAQGAGEAGKTVMALVAGEQNPYSFDGVDYVISITGKISTTGAYDVSPFKHSLAMLGLASVSETIPVTATQWLTGQQLASGSWDDGFGTGDNTDTPALAIQALLAAGLPVTDPTLVSAATYLRNNQNDDGGWGFSPDFPSTSPNSTAFAIQALVALGEDFYSSGGGWAKGSNTPLSALLALQGDSGAFLFFGADNEYATRQAIPAVAGKALPLLSRQEAARRGLVWLQSQQDLATGGFEQSTGSGVNAAGTARAIEAIAAAGDNPQGMTWTVGATNVVTALEALTPDYLNSGRGGPIGIVMQGVVAAGPPYTVTNFAGGDLVASLANYLSPTGQYDVDVFKQSEAMLGLLAAGQSVPISATAWLTGEQNNDGSWPFEPDSVGLALQALGEAGLDVNEPTVVAALSYLAANQRADGGWSFAGTPSSLNSTGEVAQGLLAVGHDPRASTWVKVYNGVVQSPLELILSRQSGDGSWPGFAGPDESATVDAILALMADYPPFVVGATYLPLATK